MTSAPGQVILKGISSVKEGYPPLFAETPLQTSSSPPRNTNSSPAVISPVRLLSSHSPLLMQPPHLALSADLKAATQSEEVRFDRRKTEVGEVNTAQNTGSELFTCHVVFRLRVGLK